MKQRSAVYVDVVARWTGNRTLDLEPYMLTPLADEADNVWHQEALRRYCLEEARRR